jgi:hypothetical protein
MRACVWVIALLCAAMPAVADADSNPWGMSYVETSDLKLIYFDQLDYLAPHVTRTFTNSLAWQRRMFGWTPSQPTTVLLRDLSDLGAATAGPAPRNRIAFDVAPISHAFETFPASERFYSFMNHEMVHIAQGDVANETDLRWRKFFLGKVFPVTQNPETLLYNYLTVPRWIAPRWYVEGSAVFFETWMGGGLGRAQGGYDEMVFRAMVRDGARFYDPLGLDAVGMRSVFQTGANAYLYGTRFMTWLAYTYGPGKIVAWIRRDEGSERHYADNFRQVFGRSIDEAWADWIAFEREFQRRNLVEVRRNPITPFRPLSAGAVGSISRVHFDEASGELYGAFRYPGVVEHVAAVNTRDGTVRRLADIKRGIHYKVAAFAYDAATGTAFFTNDNVAMRDLLAVDVKTGATRMLLENSRIGDLAFNPVDRSLWGVEYRDGLAYLVRIPYPYNDWFRIHAFPYENVPYDLDISPDGKLLSASMSEANADQFLRVWEIDRILAGDVKPASEFRFGQSVPESFVFSKDGRYLYGSSYYTGASNIFRYEVATGEVEAVSNAETGFFRPMPLADGRLVVLTYTADGFVPGIIDAKPIKDVSAITFLGAEVAEKHPVVKEWQMPPPSTVDYEKLVIRKDAYDPPRHLSLESAFPVLQGYKNRVGVGYRFNFSDPLNFVNLGILAAWTPNDSLPSSERGHFEIAGNYLGYRGALSWNRSDFYDIFGPVQRSRKGYAAKLGYDHSVIWDEPRRFDLKFDVAWYDQIDTLPGAQNVGTTSDHLLTGEVGAYYTDVRRSIGAVDDEKGIAWSAIGTANRAGETSVQGRVTFDYGWDLPVGNSSVWLRTAAGASSGSRDDPVANFYFGGFGNNYVDSRSVKRYREWDSFPGFGINELSGLSYVRPMVEWNLPPVASERAGTPAFHLSWVRPAVFASVLWTDPDRPAHRKDYANAGLQFDLRFSVLHWYDMTLSAGYAVGFREGRRAGDEWMVSLKIM